MDLPQLIDLNQDARRCAPKSYFQLILVEENSKYIETRSQNFLGIEDAMFTQKISDQIIAIGGRHLNTVLVDSGHVITQHYYSRSRRRLLFSCDPK